MLNCSMNECPACSIHPFTHLCFVCMYVCMYLLSMVVYLFLFSLLAESANNVNPTYAPHLPTTYLAIYRYIYTPYRVVFSILAHLSTGVYLWGTHYHHYWPTCVNLYNTCQARLEARGSRPDPFQPRARATARVVELYYI